MPWLTGGKIVRRGFGLSTDELKCISVGIASLAMSLISATIFYVLSILESDYQIAYSIACVLMVFISMNTISSIRDRIHRHRLEVRDEWRRLRFVVMEIEEEKERA